MGEGIKCLRSAGDALSRTKAIENAEFGYPVRGLEELSREDLKQCYACGGGEPRRALIMELVARGAEKGERHMIIDLSGDYSPLAEYIPSLRFYRVGDYAAVNVFRMEGAAHASAMTVAGEVAYCCELSRDERSYLARGLEMAYADGCRAPSARDVLDRLLQIQAEVQPKEAYKIECLKNVLWELEAGLIGAMSEVEETSMQTPAVVDLRQLPSWGERALVAESLMPRSLGMDATTIVVDPADWLLPAQYGREKPFPLRGWLDELISMGKSALLGLACAGDQRGILSGATSIIFCNPIWGEELGQIGRGFGLEADAFRKVKGLGEGFALACTRGRESPILLRLAQTDFRTLSPRALMEHMNLLGETVVSLDTPKARRERMLEKIFTDRAALVYAWELLRLVQTGRVTVESVVRQRNVAIKAVVKTLKRFFMVVEFADSTGASCYRLTKAGERAIEEMDGGGYGDDKGKTRGP